MCFAVRSSAAVFISFAECVLLVCLLPGVLLLCICTSQSVYGLCVCCPECDTYYCLNDHALSCCITPLFITFVYIIVHVCLQSQRVRCFYVCPWDQNICLQSCGCEIHELVVLVVCSPRLALSQGLQVSKADNQWRDGNA